MAKVEWSGPARAELDQIIEYIETFDPVAAERVGDRLFALGQSLMGFPNRGRMGPYGTRELVTVPPYIPQYDVTGDTVTILRVPHGRRRPVA
ncbi:MAG: type II toxin-antitoxin system RelE/ParE family toxin [Pseudomonadota bacterium]